jgi:hypothetical protein
MGAGHLAAALHADQRGHEFDAQAEALLQRAVEHRAGHAGGVGRVVLHQHGDPVATIAQPRQQGLDQGAGGAFALGNHDQAIGQGHGQGLGGWMKPASWHRPRGRFVPAATRPAA